jgi:6-pyruvoyltetrahydropterin/6-carboxytetrahydropterin synthase
MFEVKKKLKSFSAAHRLIKAYQGKCRTLHGHNYDVEVCLQACQLNNNDLVLDFSTFTTPFNHFIQTHLDHAIITNPQDQALCDFINQAQQKAYMLPDNKNSSVEVLAKHLFEIFSDILTQMLATGVSLKSVCVYESATSSATYLNQSKTGNQNQ